GGARQAGRRVDPRPPEPLYFMTLRVPGTDPGAMHGQAYISAAQPEAEEQARVSRTDEHAGRPGGDQSAAEEGSQAADRRDRLEVSRASVSPASRRPVGSRRLPRARRITRS